MNINVSRRQTIGGLAVAALLAAIPHPEETLP